jgi:hypothetical protein
MLHFPTCYVAPVAVTSGDSGTNPREADALVPAFCSNSAMGKGPPPGLSEEKAARMMVALRGGGTLNKFGVRAPRLEAYFNTHREYAQEARPLIEKNMTDARRRKGACIRNKTHCANGHSFAEHGRVAFHKGYLTRQCRACEVMRYRRGDVIKAAVLEKVTTRLIAGSSIGGLTKTGRGYLVRFSTLARYRRENPHFDRFVVDVSKANNSKGQKLRWQRIHNSAVRDQNNDYYKIRAMLPANFPDKDDVLNSIFVDLLTGSLHRKDVAARVASYITAHNRMFPTKYAMRSLDAPLYDDGIMTLGDTITHGLWN